VTRRVPSTRIPSTRRGFVAVAASAVLTFTGVVALTFAPSTAHADSLSPQTPEYSVKPGDTQTQTFQQNLIGNGGAVTNTPDACRTDPVESLTCSAHRLHLTRTPGLKLKIVLEWTNAGGDVNSVPDLDMYIFDGPNTSLDKSVGGAGTTAPEQANFVPAKDNYDIVVQAFAGAVTSYKLTVYYTNEINRLGAVTPDIILNPNQKPFVQTYTSALAGENGEPALYPVVHQKPDDCRNNPAYTGLCDVYRVKLNRNRAKGALNFVVIELDWNATTLPDLALVAAGLGLGSVPDLDIFVWDAPDHEVGRDAVGGQGQSIPERAGFTATQDEYDIVIQSDVGPSSSYKLTAYMTDELFNKPFEILDPVTGLPVGTTPADDGNAFAGIIPDGSGTVPPLALAPIDSDSQIAGIGLGTTEQFGSDLQLGGQALRATATTATPPSGLVLVLALLLLPLAVLGGGVFALRRRHSDLF
jgi:hypothetical protein